MKQFMKDQISRLTDIETPFYVYFENELMETIAKIKKKFGQEITLCYSIKANPLLVPYIQEVVDHYEVCSYGEYQICKKILSEGQTIIYGGVCKQKYELEEAVEDPRVILTVESITQIKEINEISKEKKKVSRVFLRLSIGNQFGLSREDLCRVVEQRDQFKNVKIIGVQQYAKTQCFKIEDEKKQITHMMEIVYEIEESTNYDFNIVDYGAGVGVPYYKQDYSVFNMDDMISGISQLLIEHKGEHKVMSELGRIITASCGVFISRVIDQKRTEGRTYSILDGGSNHIKYYGQAFGARKVVVEIINNESNTDVYSLCGPLCTVSDILLKDEVLVKHQIGDIILFPNAGAYCQTEANVLFLSRDLPAAFLVDKAGIIHQIREKISTYSINSGLENG